MLDQFPNVITEEEHENVIMRKHHTYLEPANFQGTKQCAYFDILYSPTDCSKRWKTPLRNCHESNETTLLNDINVFLKKASNMSKKSLLTREVCDALLSLADMRESLYGLTSIEDDIEALASCNLVRERKLYHSLVLRISERKIIQKLRNYASHSCKITNPSSARKKLKRTTKR